MTQVVAIFPIVPGRGELVLPPLPEGPVVILGHHVFPEVSRGEGPQQEHKLYITLCRSEESDVSIYRE